MIKVKDLAIELSIKVGDPRQDNGDGSLFFKEDRIRYIQRAYGKLTRTLEMAMRDYKPQFVLPLEPASIQESKIVDKASPYAFNANIISVEEVVVKRKEGTKTISLMASKLNPKNYNQVKFGLDEINKASADNIFYFFMNGVLYLLPDDKKYVALDAMIVQDLVNITADTILPIDNVYSDLLITLGAIEAMNDLPNPQKVQLYRTELVDHISVLASYANLMERSEGEKR